MFGTSSRKLPMMIHCAVIQAELVDTATTMLEIPVSIIEHTIDLERQEETLILESIDGRWQRFPDSGTWTS